MKIEVIPLEWKDNTILRNTIIINTYTETPFGKIFIVPHYTYFLIEVPQGWPPIYTDFPSIEDAKQYIIATYREVILRLVRLEGIINA